jgi:scyllo-inositol 2-dehydrogenase (NADP+)
MGKLAVGIIGFGRIGNEHAAWLRQCADIEPTAVADATPARRELARASSLKTFEFPEQMLSDAAIDAVLIATPTSMHADHAMAAIEAGKHVMIEKPMALDLPQAKRIVDAATARQCIVSVFHNRRWDLDYLTVNNAIASGLLGPRVFNVESRLGQWSSCVGPAAREYRPNWRNEAAFGGGGLYDWGSHFVDQIWRLMFPARPMRVFAQLRGNVWSSDCDDFARICIDFDNGSVGMVEINTTTTRPLPRWHVDGTAGSIDSPFSLDFDVRTWATMSFTPSDKNEPPRQLPLATAGLDEVEIWDRFAAAVRGEGPPAVSVASVLPTMALLDAARASAREGVAVKPPSDVTWVY